ncbi:hypothetical protein QTP70_007093 [Hemibagrus guttatus]|uniref:ribonuclease H n=1 Tax=Hemibagrus guttatus TaxID=175788 RepID=A0AAE0RJP8_9TELE|nr:hypothetical protein QTP70_007093 [Hemibagrus guttatus]KAK3574297.1 hypothetical protein QTP86_004355 [Hemibagrus guttatus]
MMHIVMHAVEIDAETVAMCQGGTFDNQIFERVVLPLLWTVGTFSFYLPTALGKHSVPYRQGRTVTGLTHITPPSNSGLFLPISLTWGTLRHELKALVDSGAAGNFMDTSLVKSLQIPFDSLHVPLTVTALDEKTLTPAKLWTVTLERPWQPGSSIRPPPLRVLGFSLWGKKGGGLHPCIDYRGLNKITICNRYPLPLMATAFEVLQGVSIFTKLDLRNAYHLMCIRQGDERKMAFNTPTGHYEYLVMPFSLTNAPVVFQALINDVLRDMLNQMDSQKVQAVMAHSLIC